MSDASSGLKVAGLYRYPVKSLRGHRLQSATVELIGFAGDRRWCLIDAAGKVQTIRELPVMTQIDVEPTPNGLSLSHADHGVCVVDTPVSLATVEMTIWGDRVAAMPASGHADAFLSQVLGETVRLVYLADPAARPVDQTYGLASDRVSFADGYPMLLTTEASLDDLAVRLGNAIDMRRFRPNIVLSGSLAWAEDEWKVLRINGIVFRVAKPCGRCVVTTRDHETGEQTDPSEPLKTLARFRRAAKGGIIFGQNLIPDGIGTISVGDPIEILASGRSNLLAAE